jgi:hypothetical protein
MRDGTKSQKSQFNRIVNIMDYEGQRFLFREEVTKYKLQEKGYDA